MDSIIGKNNKKAKIFLIALLSIILLILFSLIVMIITIFVLRRVQKKAFFKRGPRKRYFGRNPLKNTTSVGFTTISRQLAHKDFISFHDENDNYFLISDFDSVGYECHGRCYCEEDSYRRSSIALSRGIMYLVAATSSVAAFELAKTYFEDECVKSMEDDDTCSPTSIRSEIEDCGPLREETGEEKDENGGTYKNFHCIGNCMTASKKSFPWVSEIKNPEDLMCEELELNTQVYNVRVNNIDESKEIAILNFLKNELSEFCQSNSMENIVFRGENREVGVCVAHQNDFINPLAECVEMWDEDNTGGEWSLEDGYHR